MFVSRTLEKFFGCLAEDMQGLVVDDTPLIGMIGKKIAGELVDMIVKECLSVAVPYSAEEKPEFEKLLATAENFRNYLVSLGLFTSETITFKKFADSYDTVFINRRCTAFIVKARSLINAPLMPLLEVGSDEREKCEATETFMKAKLFVGRSATSKQCSSLMQLMRCKVSESCVKLFKLVEDCLKEAADSDSDVAAGRLFQTALNMVQLFVLVAPRQHEAQLSSVPLIAGKLFFSGPPYGMSFMESLPGLRKLAATLMESQLTQCRRQLRTILADDQSSFFF
ncbi:unnamed protein product [Toxocara canis]|uniref:Ras-GAP domain-containing protein n=1 Tax=Toxocara canis TaxID=6265 RepID=A0A183U2K3_TOXCA|nr:unnamed protein product [Toxocara canis]